MKPGDLQPITSSENSREESGPPLASDAVTALRTTEEELGDRATWPWLPGTVLQRVGPDEFQIVVEVPELATLEDGSLAPEATPDDDLWYPVCFRDAAEIKLPGGAR
jgi:hypothetical protein